MRRPRGDIESLPGDGWIRLAPGATFAWHNDTQMSPTVADLQKGMNDIRGGVLSASFGIENELILLALAEEFGTNDRGKIGSEYFQREQGWREDHSLERKIDRVKPIIRKLRTKEVSDQIIQKLAEYRTLRNLLAHYPCWIEPVNREGVQNAEDQRTIALKLFIADRQHAWEIDKAQVEEWSTLLRFARVSVENVRREMVGAPLLDADGALPQAPSEPVQTGVQVDAKIAHGNVSQIVFPTRE